jgi:hypothetical protein
LLLPKASGLRLNRLLWCWINGLGMHGNMPAMEFRQHSLVPERIARCSEGWVSSLIPHYEYQEFTQLLSQGAKPNKL